MFNLVHRLSSTTSSPPSVERLDELRRKDITRRDGRRERSVGSRDFFSSGTLSSGTLPSDSFSSVIFHWTRVNLSGWHRRGGGRRGEPFRVLLVAVRQNDRLEPLAHRQEGEVQSVRKRLWHTDGILVVTASKKFRQTQRMSLAPFSFMLGRLTVKCIRYLLSGRLGRL